MSYYVRTDEPEFTSALKKQLEEHEYVESSKFPVDFVFLSGKYAYQRNLFNMKQSVLTNVTKKILITNKVELHNKFKDSKFINPFEVIHGTIPDINTVKILKPEDGYAGEGITIVNTQSDIEEWLQKHKASSWLLQDYIQNPALKCGHKFHLRVPILVFSNKVFVHTKSPYYIAKSPYKNEDFLNKSIHDTHYNPKFKYFYPESLPDNWKRTTNILDVFKTVFNGVQLHPDWNSNHVYKLFGADLMFDGRKPILLEVNDQIGLKDMEFVIPGMLAAFEGRDSDFKRIL